MAGETAEAARAGGAVRGGSRPKAAPRWPGSRNRSRLCASKRRPRRNGAREIELELVKKQAELKYLDETSRKELNIAAAEVASGEESQLDETGVAEAEQRYQEVRAKIEALGPVNPQALEEFQEAQQRYDFLNTQRQDLLDSIRDTEKAIQELDHGIAAPVQGSLRSDQRAFPADVPDAVRRRPGRDAPDR